jgi:hypothetical protein
MKKTALALSLGLVVACSQSPAGLLSPNSVTNSGSGAGPNGETMKVTAPELVFPVNVVDLDDDDPDFEFRHATAKYAGAQTFTYDFEVFVGSNRVHALSIPQSNGATTRFEIPAVMERGVQFTWRVRARLGSLVGPWSSSATFSTKPQPTCAHLGPNPLAIIGCHRDRFPPGRVDGELEAFDLMTSIARDLNKTRYDDWDTWGVLQKLEGRNCNGISCDIICRGNGTAQKQWDVLLSSETPKWDAPDEFPHIRMDVCLIQR